MMSIVNNEWGDKVLNFKDDPLVWESYRSIWITGTYWPVPGNQKDDSLQLED